MRIKTKRHVRFEKRANPAEIRRSANKAPDKFISREHVVQQSENNGRIVCQGTRALIK